MYLCVHEGNRSSHLLTFRVDHVFSMFLFPDHQHLCVRAGSLARVRTKAGFLKWLIQADTASLDL